MQMSTDDMFEMLNHITTLATEAMLDCVGKTGEEDKAPILEKALGEIAKALPHRSPYELPFDVKLARLASPKTVLFVGRRACTTERKEPDARMCWVVCNRDTGTAEAYYDNKRIGSASVELGSHVILERAGIGLLRAYLESRRHNVENRQRRRAARKAEAAE